MLKLVSHPHLTFVNDPFGYLFGYFLKTQLEKFSKANMSLPSTSSFIGEFLILVGAFQKNC
jgi:hypothetical protein